MSDSWLYVLFIASKLDYNLVIEQAQNSTWEEATLFQRLLCLEKERNQVVFKSEMPIWFLQSYVLTVYTLSRRKTSTF